MESAENTTTIKPTSVGVPDPKDGFSLNRLLLANDLDKFNLQEQKGRVIYFTTATGSIYKIGEDRSVTRAYMKNQRPGVEKVMVGSDFFSQELQVQSSADLDKGKLESRLTSLIQKIIVVEDAVVSGNIPQNKINNITRDFENLTSQARAAKEIEKKPVRRYVILEKGNRGWREDTINIRGGLKSQKKPGYAYETVYVETKGENDQTEILRIQYLPAETPEGEDTLEVVVGRTGKTYKYPKKSLGQYNVDSFSVGNLLPFGETVDGAIKRLGGQITEIIGMTGDFDPTQSPDMNNIEKRFKSSKQTYFQRDTLPKVA